MMMKMVTVTIADSVRLSTRASISVLLQKQATI